MHDIPTGVSRMYLPVLFKDKANGMYLRELLPDEGLSKTNYSVISIIATNGAIMGIN